MQTKELDDVLLEELTSKSKSLILYNDDINTFEHVIKCLQIYCNHDLIQAEQCAYIVHNKGKCSIKNGSLDDLLHIKVQLLMHKLNVEIE
jgi:ATP-dependent Clp protease adaptor protein ClpS